MNAQYKALSILLVEDDDLDILGIERALDELKISNNLIVAHDGIEALDCLRGTAGKDKIQSPFLILLDINMPRMNGIEFLSELRADPEFTDAKVFILTGSNEDDDIYRAYKQDVAGYIVKSSPMESLQQAIQLNDVKWLIVEDNS